jgi:hypothetical protein
MPWKHMGEWRYSSTLLDLGTRCRWVVSFILLLLHPWKRAPGTHWIGGWVRPRVDLDSVEKRKILHCWESNLGRPASSLSLCQLQKQRRQSLISILFIIKYNTSSVTEIMKFVCSKWTSDIERNASAKNTWKTRTPVEHTFSVSKCGGRILMSTK